MSLCADKILYLIVWCQTLSTESVILYIYVVRSTGPVILRTNYNKYYNICITGDRSKQNFFFFFFSLQGAKIILKLFSYLNIKIFYLWIKYLCDNFFFFLRLHIICLVLLLYLILINTAENIWSISWFRIQKKKSWSFTSSNSLSYLKNHLQWYRNYLQDSKYLTEKEYTFKTKQIKSLYIKSLIYLQKNYHFLHRKYFFQELKPDPDLVLILLKFHCCLKVYLQVDAL